MSREPAADNAAGPVDLHIVATATNMHERKRLPGRNETFIAIVWRKRGAVPYRFINIYIAYASHRQITCYYPNRPEIALYTQTRGCSTANQAHQARLSQCASLNTMRRQLFCQSVPHRLPTLYCALS